MVSVLVAWGTCVSYRDEGGTSLSILTVCDCFSMAIYSFKLSVDNFKLRSVPLLQSPIVLCTCPGSFSSKIKTMIGAQAVTSTFKASYEHMSPIIAF